MSTMRYPKQRTVVWCGTVIVVGCLAFSLLLLSVLTSTEGPDLYGTTGTTRRAKLIRARGDGSLRNILDVHRELFMDHIMDDEPETRNGMYI